jgi:hypothetical protein
MHLYYHVACFRDGRPRRTSGSREEKRLVIANTFTSLSGVTSPHRRHTGGDETLRLGTPQGAVCLVNVTCKTHGRPSDLSLTGTFHAPTLLTLYCTDSFSMFGVVGAEFTTNLMANSLQFDIIVGLLSIILTLNSDFDRIKTVANNDRVRLC